MKRLITISIMLLLISSSCKPDRKYLYSEIEIDDSIHYPLKLIKEKEIRIDTDKKKIPVIRKIKSRNSVFISIENKKRDIEFLRYDTDLVLKGKKTIPFGQGPNERLLPTVVGGDEDNLIIFDIMSKKYHIYDGDLKCKSTLEAKTLGANWIPHGANFSEKKNTFLTCLAEVTKPGVFEYRLYLRKREGNTLKDTEIFKIQNNVYSEKGLFTVAHPVHFSLIDNSVFILNPKEYRLIKMDLEGNVLREIKVVKLPVIRFTPKERGEWTEQAGRERMQFTFPEYLWHACWILELGDGIAVGRRENYKPDTMKWIGADYFDNELNYLGKVKVPWFPNWNYPDQVNSDIFFYSKGDKLFSIEVRETEADEEYWLTRWKIEQ